MTKYRKSWTETIKEVILNEALKPLDKSVVDAFYYKKEKAGKVVSTDGDSLWKNGLVARKSQYGWEEKFIYQQ